MKKVIIVRYGELSTKGKNKKDFILTLGRNITNALKDFDKVEVDVSFDHTYIYYDEKDLSNLIFIIKSISGIHSFSLACEVNLDMDEITEHAIKMVENRKPKTFKLIVNRANKTFPLRSVDIIKQIATPILKNNDIKVDVHNPELPLNIEIRTKKAYLFSDTIKGAGGYPLGVGGKIMVMLSGGIDSPVASYLIMKRGVMIECVHFASPPYTSSGVILKIKDILKVLNRYQNSICLHIIPFTKLQEKIYECAEEGYAITLMRRMMYRIASKLAAKYKLKAIASGESIGQVASQTIDSLFTINEVTNMPIIRPLIAFDKEDIIKLSKEIDTYDISIRPYEDCCTIFTPKNPKTKPNLEKSKEIESFFDFESLIEEAIANEEKIYIKK